VENILFGAVLMVILLIFHSIFLYDINDCKTQQGIKIAEKEFATYCHVFSD
jgi:hypothetical protein